MTVDDLGGLTVSAHWIEELSTPLKISSDQIHRDLIIFMMRFPINSIPYSTDTEKKIKMLKKEIIKIKIKVLKLKQKHEISKVDSFQNQMALLNIS